MDRGRYRRTGKQAPVAKPMGAHLVLQRAHLVLQRKRGHGGRARPIVSCTCDRERTNSDNESSDNGEYDLNHRSLPFRRGALCVTAMPCLRCDRRHKLFDSSDSDFARVCRPTGKPLHCL
jgi:hypothetical protein